MDSESARSRVSRLAIFRNIATTSEDEDVGEISMEEGEHENEMSMDLSNIESTVERRTSNDMPKYRYTKEMLLELRTHELSNVRPKFLNNFRLLEKKNDKPDSGEAKKTVKKHVVFRTSEQTTERRDFRKPSNQEKNSGIFGNKNLSSQATHQLKIVDNKEVLKKDQDVVLSPQRRSFNSGCFVSNRRSSESDSSATTKNTENHEVTREAPRRTSSGRVSNREHRDSDSSHTNNSGCEYHWRNATAQGGEMAHAVFERRNNNYDKDNHKFRDNRFNNRNYSNNNNYQNHNNRGMVEEEPEWFKGGPTSLSDTIELRGFDEVKDRPKKNNRNVFSRGIAKLNDSVEKTSAQKTPDTKESKKSAKPSVKNHADSANSSTNAPPASAASKNAIKDVKDTINVVDEKPKLANPSILEEILKMDSLPDIIPSNSETTQSRFASWFKRDSPEAKMNETIDKKDSNLNDGKTSANINGDLNIDDKNVSSNEFVAADASKKNVQNSEEHVVAQSVDLTELFRASQNKPAPVTKTPFNIKVLETTGQLHSVDEIEAKLRGSNLSEHKPVSSNVTSKKNKEEESLAFKQLLAQAMAPLAKRPVSTSPTNNNTTIFQNNASDDANKFNDAFQNRSNGLSEKEWKDNLSRFDIPTHLVQEMKRFQPSQQEQPNRPQQPLQLQQQHPSQMQPLPQSGVQNSLKGNNCMIQTPHQQEIFAKMLTSASTGMHTDSAPPGINVSNVPAVLKIPTEVQALVNVAQPTEAILQRTEVQRIMKGLTDGDITHSQLIDQLKRTTNQHGQFRESVLCILKLLQHQAIHGPVQNPLIPYMRKAIFNEPVQNSTPIIPAQPQQLQQGFVNVQTRENSSHLRTITKPGLLQTISVEQKHIPLKDLELNKTKPSSPSITQVHGTAVDNSSMKSENFVDDDLSTLPRLSTPITTSTPASVLWTMSSRSLDEVLANSRTILNNANTQQQQLLQRNQLTQPPLNMPIQSQQVSMQLQSMQQQQRPQMPMNFVMQPLQQYPADKLWPAQKALPGVPNMPIPPGMNLQQLQMRHNMNLHSQQLQYGANYNVNPLLRKPTPQGVPFLGYNQNLNFLGPAVVPVVPQVPANRISTTNNKEQFSRYFSQEILGQQARSPQLPNVVPSPSNMLSLEEVEKMQQVRN